MYLEIFIFIFFVFIQLLQAIRSFFISSNLDYRYGFILGENIEAAKTLENYVRIYRSVNIKVDALIKEPAKALDNFVLINKSRMYSTDLFTNFYLIFQLEFSKSSYNLVRKTNVFHNFIFIFQITFFILGIILNTEFKKYFLLFAIILQLLNFLIAYLVLNKYTQVLRHTFFIANDILNLDEVEQARAESLIYRLKSQSFLYPFIAIFKVMRFFLP